MAKKKRLYVIYYEKPHDKKSGRYLKSIDKITGKKTFTLKETHAMIFDNGFSVNKILKIWNNQGPYYFKLLVTGGQNKFDHLMGANPEIPTNLKQTQKYSQNKLF